LYRHRSVELPDADCLLEISAGTGGWQRIYFETI
jgi:hypothetical protein